MNWTAGAAGTFQAGAADRSSTTSTREAPARTSAPVRLLPMHPAPPVTRITLSAYEPSTTPAPPGDDHECTLTESNVPLDGVRKATDPDADYARDPARRDFPAHGPNQPDDDIKRAAGRGSADPRGGGQRRPLPAERAGVGGRGLRRRF